MRLVKYKFEKCYRTLIFHFSILTFQLVVPIAFLCAVEPPITAATFSPDGNSVVAVSQSGLHVFSWPALERQRTIRTSASNLHRVEFSPNGKRIAIGGGNPSEDGIVELLS